MSFHVFNKLYFQRFLLLSKQLTQLARLSTNVKILQRCHVQRRLLVPCQSLALSQERGYAKAKQAKAKKSDGIAKPKVPLSDEEMLEVVPIDEFKSDLKAIVESFKHDLATNVSVRSSSSLADLPVEFDGQEHLLKEIGFIVEKNPQLITINMSSLPDAIKPVLKAIQESGMNLNPQQDGTMIYVAIPKVTVEHRQGLAKSAKNLFNKVRDDIRHTQNNYVKIVDLQEGVSKDLVLNVKENLMYLAKVATKECENLMNSKVNSLIGDQKF